MSEELNNVCTWERCRYMACFPHCDADGKRWADLCPTHNDELTRAVEFGSVPRIMAAYIKANGGPKECVRKLTDNW